MIHLTKKEIEEGIYISRCNICSCERKTGPMSGVYNVNGIPLGCWTCKGDPGSNAAEIMKHKGLL